jgi:phosphopantetheine adenylyltransferase
MEPAPTQHERIIVAGTFDVLHAGHYAMLHTAFARAGRAEIWISDDASALAKGAKLGQNLRSFKERSSQIVSWCEKHGYGARFSVHELRDAFGDSLTDGTYTAIVVSEETRSGGELINSKRAAAGLAPLEIVVTPLVIDESGEKLSSSALRARAAAAAASESASSESSTPSAGSAATPL